MTTPDPQPTPLSKDADRIENLLEKINARIARLAKIVGAKLDTEADFEQLLNHDTPFLQSRAGGHEDHSLSEPEHRQFHAWTELRGLLVLRTRLTAHTISKHGLQVALQIATQAEENLSRDGFAHGAEGYDVLRDWNL